MTTMKKIEMVSPAGKILSSTALMLVLDCVDKECSRLEKLHWQILPFLPTTQNKEGENALDTLTNLALYSHNLQIAKLYEAQFEEPTKTEMVGGSTANSSPRKTKRKKV